MSGSATYQKLRPFKSLLSLSKKKKEVVAELDLESNGFSAENFDYAMKYLKNKE